MIQYTEIVSSGNTLRGYLHKPDHFTGKIPMVLIFHGFCSDLNEVNFVHADLSRTLCEHGIASIRMAFAGSDTSDGRFEDMTVSNEVRDAETILAYVRTLDWVDQSRIAVHGTSMGGMVASLVAGRNSSVIRALSMWCPATDAIMEGARSRSICGTDITNIEKDGYADVEGLRLGAGFYRDLVSMPDPYEVAGQYQGPVNTVHGDVDTTASISTSYHMKELFGDRCNFLIVHGAEHRFKSIEFKRLRMDSACSFLCRELGVE